MFCLECSRFSVDRLPIVCQFPDHPMSHFRSCLGRLAQRFSQDSSTKGWSSQLRLLSGCSVWIVILCGQCNGVSFPHPNSQAAMTIRLGHQLPSRQFTWKSQAQLPRKDRLPVPAGLFVDAHGGPGVISAQEGAILGVSMGFGQLFWNTHVYIGLACVAVRVRLNCQSWGPSLF